jgi:hypothetical protein
MTLDRQEHQGDAIAELQGLNIELLAGATGGTKIDLAAIRAKDTILKALVEDVTSGKLVDDTANVTITDIRASGTLTVAAGNGILDGEFFTVGDQVFTFVAGLTSVRKLVHSGGANLPISAVDNVANAANIEEAINLVFGRDKVFGVIASRVTNVVTVTARQEGVVGNSIVLTEAATDVAAVAMAGGSDTGGVQSATDNSTDQIILYWYQKAHELSPK